MHTVKPTYIIRKAATFISALCVSILISPDVDGQTREREFRYAITHIPGLGGGLDFVRAINDHGHVVGESLIPDNSAFHPMYWDGSTTRDLGTFGGKNGRARDINNDGWVVGGADEEDDRSRAFVWKGQGALVALKELPGGTASASFAISNSGHIAGNSFTPDALLGRAVLWEDESTVIDLGTLEGDDDLSSSAYDINEQGYITGWSGMNKGGQLAFLWDGEEMVHIGSLGDGMQRTVPHAMNDDNMIVGQGEQNDSNTPNPVMFSDGDWYNLLWLLGPRNFHRGSANDVNNSGQVVATIGHKGLDQFFGVIWEQGEGIRWLNDLIPPNSGWLIEIAPAINEHGQIAAVADPIPNPDNFARSLLLTPVDPELTLELADGPLRAGEQNTFRITGAEPGATIKFFYGREGGGKRISDCDELDAMLQFNDPRLFAEATADDLGVIEIEIMVPPIAARLPGILLQAADFNTCQESQLVQKAIE